jgi:integrase
MGVYKRGKRWGAVIYEPAIGSRRWLGTFDTKADAREIFEDARKRSRRGGRVETIASFAARWMDDYPRRKESTTKHYRQQIKALASELGHLRLDQLDRPTAREFAQRSSTWPAARAMFSDAVRDELCDRNPFLNMRLSQGRGRRDLVAPTAVDVDRLAEAAGRVHGKWGERVYGPLILFAAYVGARPGELHGLDWRHVDRRGRTVTVERQWNPKLRKMTAPKNGKPRTVWLPDRAMDALDRLPDTGNALFTTPRGARLGGTVTHYYWHPVRCAFGRPDLDFYALRHFYGTMLAGLGVAAENIAEAMGHTDGGKLALTTYIHATGQGSRAAIAAAFGGGVGAAEVRPLREAAGE